MTCLTGRNLLSSVPLSMQAALLCLHWFLLARQRYRPVLTEEFVHSLHRRGIDVDALRIEPGMPAAHGH